MVRKGNNPRPYVTKETVRKVNHLVNRVDKMSDTVKYFVEREPELLKYMGEVVTRALGKLTLHLDPKSAKAVSASLSTIFITGYLLHREATYSDIEKVLKNSPSKDESESRRVEEVNKIIDKLLSEGKEPSQIGEVLSNMFLDVPEETPKEEAKNPSKSDTSNPEDDLIIEL